MSYLLDADVLISAKRSHYRFATFPCFWGWIEAQNAAGVVFSVDKIRSELADKRDELSEWIASRDALFLPPDTATVESLPIVSAWAADPERPYRSTALTEFLASGDYWLVSQALALGFTVVTHEVPAPESKRRVKIPDVCDGLGISWMSPYQMLEDLGATF